VTKGERAVNYNVNDFNAQNMPSQQVNININGRGSMVGRTFNSNSQLSLANVTADSEKTTIMDNSHQVMNQQTLQQIQKVMKGNSKE
jgi:hypothetical protein